MKRELRAPPEPGQWYSRDKRVSGIPGLKVTKNFLKKRKTMLFYPEFVASVYMQMLGIDAGGRNP